MLPGASGPKASAGSIHPALGLVFLGGQILAWRGLAGQGLYLATTPSYSFFYVFTVLHALHLLGGIVAWDTCCSAPAQPGRRIPPWSRWGARRCTGTSWAVLWLYLLVILVLRL